MVSKNMRVLTIPKNSTTKPPWWHFCSFEKKKKLHWNRKHYLDDPQSLERQNNFLYVTCKALNLVSNQFFFFFKFNTASEWKMAQGFRTTNSKCEIAKSHFFFFFPKGPQVSDRFLTVSQDLRYIEILVYQDLGHVENI